MKWIRFNILFIILSLEGYSQTRSAEAQEFLSKGEVAYKNAQYQDAIDYYSRCISSSPVVREAYLGRAQAKEAVKDFQGALTDYNIFLELSPDNYDALLARANARYQAGQYEAALEDYLRLLELPPGETNTVMFQKSASSAGTMQITTAQSDLRPTLFNYLGLTELKLGRNERAIQWLDSAIQLQPQEPDYWANRGMAWYKSNPSKAIEDYQQALKINPGHTAALNNLAVAKSKSGDKSEALFDSAIESDSSMLAPYLERAYLRMQSGFFKGALVDYNRAIEIEKSDPEIWLNRGFVKERLNDYKGAYADYTNAILLHEAFEKAWLNRGNVLSKLGRHQEAIEDYTTALAFNPEYGSAYYNRAIARDKLKLKAEACADLLQAEKLGMTVDPKLKLQTCK